MLRHQERDKEDSEISAKKIHEFHRKAVENMKRDDEINRTNASKLKSHRTAKIKYPER